MPDLEFAHAVLVLDCDPVDDAPIWDLRLRKGVRRHGVKLAVAGARPGALDASAAAVLRTAPGGGEALLVALDAALSGDDGNLGGAATAAGSSAQAVRDMAEFLTGVGEDVVILYGERLLTGPRGAQTAQALLNLVARLGLAGREGAGLLEIPSATNGRGIREAGFAPRTAPATPTSPALAADLADAAPSVLYLLHADPVRTHADRAYWEQVLKPPFRPSRASTGPDADQQRRDADERAADPADERRGVRQDRHGALHGHEGRLRLGQRRAPGQLRDRARRAVARDHLRARGRAGEGRSIKFWFPGGSSAPVLPGTDEFLDLPYDFDSMAKAGSMLGSGAIIVVDDTVPVVDVALKTAKFYRHESCGKCTPCREGTNWTVKMLERIDDGTATPMDLDIMASVCDQIMGNCLCVLGDAMAMPIASMIKHFRPEFEAHIEAARERNEPRHRRRPHQPRRAAPGRRPR